MTPKCKPPLQLGQLGAQRVAGVALGVQLLLVVRARVVQHGLDVPAAGALHLQLGLQQGYLAAKTLSVLQLK